MSEQSDASSSVPDSNPSELSADIRYLAFCDILGFSAKVLNNFEDTIKLYKGLCDLMAVFNFKDTQVTMYSDAILLTAATLDRVLRAAQGLWFFALSQNMMLRGAITRGRYWERREGNHLFVVSDALVRAVKLEKFVGVPAVVIADDVEIPDAYWTVRFSQGPFITPLLHFRDRSIVNPFNLMWGKSAAFRASMLMEEEPEHRDKYLWFLALHKAVESGQELIPPDVLNRFLEQGILKFRQAESDTPTEAK